MLSFRVAIQLKSEMNTRSHWAARRARFRKQAEAMMFFMRMHAPYPPPPLHVALMRCYTGRAKVMDTDNLASSFKGIRDCIADELGIDDGDVARLRFEYDQRRDDENAVEVSIRPMKPAEVA